VDKEILGGIKMNKIKVLYDMVKVIKEESNHEGTLSLKISENDDVLLTLDGALEKGNAPDEMVHTLKVKGQIADHKIDHESRTLTNMQHGHRGFKKHMGGRCHGHDGHMEGHKGNKLTKMMFALDMLNKLEINELGDERVLSINLKASDLPEEFSNKMKHKAMHKMMHNHLDGENGEVINSKFEKYHQMELVDISLTANLTNDNEPKALKVLIKGIVEEDTIVLELNLNK
jgi:hypothetical protein